MTVEKSQPATPCNLWTRKTVRLQIAFLLSAAMMTCGLLRGHLGMALVCMMRSNLNSTAPEDTYTSSLQVDWSFQNVGTIHTSFYVGTFISVLIAHKLAQSVGAKNTITGGIIMNILCVWFVPTIIYFMPHYVYTALVRFIMGLGQGVFIPCASLLIAKWFPTHEKSTAMAIFSTGNQVGLALAMFATAELCKVRYLDGWPTSFFLYGLIGACFLGFWLPHVSNKPRKCRRISSDELAHIEESEYRLRAMSMNLTIPYKTLFCSPVIIAICLSSFCQSFVMVSMISYLPEYYRSVLKLGISANGYWSSIPFLIQMFSKMGFAFGADYLKVHGFKVNTITKMSNSIASFGCAICLFLVCITTNGFVIMTLVCLGLTLTSAFVPGYNTSIVSVAPSYTAVISAYAQAYAQIASVFAPLMVGFITTHSTADEWRIVFLVIAATCVVTGLFFQYFGSATIQPWAMGDHVFAQKRASSFSVRVESADSYLSIAEAETPLRTENQNFLDDIHQQKLLAIPARLNRKSPRVSIMEEDGNFVCPDGTNSIDPGLGSSWPCVSLSKEKVTFVEAVAKCKSKKGHLISISNEDVNTIISELVKDKYKGSPFPYIGVTRLLGTIWKDVDSGGNTTFFNWEKGQPNNDHNWNCVFLKPDGRWHAGECSGAWPYICGLPEINKKSSNN